MSTIVPAPTSGVGVPTQIALSGTGIANANNQTPAAGDSAAGSTYAVTLSLNSLNGHSSSVNPVTATLKDIAGTSQSSSPRSFQAISRNTLQTTNNVPPDTQESYPEVEPTPPVHDPAIEGRSTVGEIATVGAVTNNGDGTASFVVTAQNVGQAVIDVSYGQSINGQLSNYVSASLLVTVLY